MNVLIFLGLYFINILQFWIQYFYVYYQSFLSFNNKDIFIFKN